MNIKAQKLPLLSAIVLALLAGDILADDSQAEFRQALSNRELAAVGLAITVTVRGVPDCGIPANSERAEQQQRMREFFGNNAPVMGERPSQTSGILLNEEGEILSLSMTESCSSYIVSLPDGREANAQLVGVDSLTDLALLRADMSGFGTARIGDPNTLLPGDRVLAFGSPFGMERTLSEGVVSTTTRFVPDFPDSYYIQSDAMINEGSAGGPLINEFGEVVGLHALLLSRSGRFDGISFALPIDFAIRLGEDLRDFGKVKRAWIGVILEDSDAGDSGPIVAEILPDSTASGVVELGDRIVALDGETVATTGELRDLLQMYRVDSNVSVTVVRGDETVELKVSLGERPEL